MKPESAERQKELQKDKKNCRSKGTGTISSFCSATSAAKGAAVMSNAALTIVEGRKFVLFA
jgi:hypothetical protein